MSSRPPGMPEPITPRDKPLPPRGRDRALSIQNDKKANKTPPPAPPYEYTTTEPIPAATATAPHTKIHFALPNPIPIYRRHVFAWFVVLAIVGVGLAITIPFTLGVYYGNQQRNDFVESQAVQHYQRALAYESETFNELAIAELNAALQYDPNYEPAKQKLEQLKTTSTVKETQQPQDVAIAEQLYSGAQDAISKQSWSDAIDLLEELRRVKSDYRASDVTTQLVQAYINAGKDAILGNDVDLARRRFEAALALDPNNTDAQNMRDRAQLYATGSDASGSSWQSAVLAFQELYQRDPNFADVKEKLRDAHIGYGNFANAQGAYCIAAREFDAAVALGADATTQAADTVANDNCKQAILNPTATPTETPEGGVPTDEAATPVPSEIIATPLPSGVIAYTPTTRVTSAACNGTGSIKGAVQDPQGKPLQNIGIKIYNDYGYLPPYARTDDAGEYEIVLGSDKGLFHLVVVDNNGRTASAILDVNYPGGNAVGCHIQVNWTRNS